MRKAFAKRIEELMDKDKRIVFLVCDMGPIIFDSIREKYPDRFLNLGLTESSAMSISAGLALEGKIPFIYTIATFVTEGCFEQVKVDVCYQQTNVKIIGIGAGLTYGISGPSHQTISDIAMLRALPNMTILVPADKFEAEAMTDVVLNHQGPVYMRIGFEGAPEVNNEKKQISVAGSTVLSEGDDATILTYGSLVYTALLAASSLRKKGCCVRVLNMYSLKPIDKRAILSAAEETKTIITLEDHNIYGGLGSIVSEIISESGLQLKFKRVGLNDKFCLDYGDFDFVLQKNELSVNHIQQTILKLLD